MLSDGSLYVNLVFTFCYVPQTGLEPAVFLLLKTLKLVSQDLPPGLDVSVVLCA